VKGRVPRRVNTSFRDLVILPSIGERGIPKNQLDQSRALTN
jgi:hypothetical protein